MNTIIDTASQIPWWVYVLLIYLIKVGVGASKPSTISFVKIFILPIIFTVMSVHTLFTSFHIQANIISTWFGSIFAGGFVGWLLVRNQSIQIDRKNLLIYFPGTWLTLILVLIIFFSKFYFGYELSVDPELMKQTLFELSFLIVSGACTGLFVGRAGFYSYLMVTQESINLINKK